MLRKTINEVEQWCAVHRQRLRRRHTISLIMRDKYPYRHGKNHTDFKKSRQAGHAAGNLPLSGPAGKAGRVFVTVFEEVLKRKVSRQIIGVLPLWQV